MRILRSRVLVRTICAALVGFQLNTLAFSAYADSIASSQAAGRAIGQQALQAFPSSQPTMTLQQLYPDSGNADTTDLQSAFGSDTDTVTKGSDAQKRLTTEDSREGDAYRLLTDSSRRISPNLSNDPMFNQADQVRSSDYMSAFKDNFADCSRSDKFVDTTRKSHIPKYETCERLNKPQGNCDISHEIKIKAAPVDLVFVVDNSGSMESVIAELRTSVSQLASLLGATNEGDLRLGGVVSRGDQFLSNQVQLTEDTATFKSWIEHVGVNSGPTYTTAAANYVIDNYQWRTGVQKVLVIIGNEDGAGGDVASLKSKMAALGFTAFIFHDNASVQSIGTYIASRFSATGLYKMAQFLTIVEDTWTPKECLDAAVATLEEFCTGSYSETVGGAGQCVNLSGFDVCPGDAIYNKLRPPPIPNVDRLALKVHVTDLQCDFNKGQMDCFIDAQGVQQCPQNAATEMDTCKAKESNPSCGFVSQSCIGGASGSKGTCYAYNEVWDCGYDVNVPTLVNTGTQIECPGGARCMGSECFDTSNTKSGDFAYAVAMLQVSQFAEHDLSCATEGSLDCKVFKGDASECKKALGGYVDCCEAPAGVSLFDYVNLTMNTLKLTSALEALSRDQAMTSGYWYAATNGATAAAGEIVKGQWGSIVDAASGAWDKTLTGNMAVGQIEQWLMQQAYDAMVQMGAQGAAQSIFTTTTSSTGSTAVTGFAPQVTAVVNFIGWVYMAYVVTDMLIKTIWKCEKEEFEMAAKKETNQCHFVGSYCATKVLGSCVEKRESYCCFGSVVAKIIQEQGRQQLGLDFGDPKAPSCDGLTPTQLGQMDWSKVDLSEWIGMLQVTGNLRTPSAASLDSITGNGSKLGNIFKTGDRANTLNRNVDRLEQTNPDDIKRKAELEMKSNTMP